MAKQFKVYPNSGTLFRTRVKKSEKSPDYFGDVTLDIPTVTRLMESIRSGSGEPLKLQLAGWKKVSGNGNQFLSLSVKIADDAKPETKSAAPDYKMGKSGDSHPATRGMDDDIPF